MKPSMLFRWPPHALAVAGALACAAVGPGAHAATPAGQLAGYTAQAGTPAVPARGQQFFNTRHGRDWSCASCHGAVPTQAGRHASTGKTNLNGQRLQPFAPVLQSPIPSGN
jgi:hypothetical protein